MEWAKDFYSKQVKWFDIPARWAEFSLDDVPDRFKRRVAAIERLAGAGAKRILELGPGGGATAAALADGGCTVVAVEIVGEFAANCRRLAEKVRNGKFIVVQGDFYEIELNDTFDVVCYFDGFGIGTDGDQRRLLRRIAAWLKPDGCALIDILTPWYWADQIGKEYRFGAAVGRFAFDAEGCRMVDRLWPQGDESQAITQTIRCYSPADLRLLLEGTGLALQTLEPYESEKYERSVPWEQAMLYLAKLGRA
jgi:SAM-dependent methyltransferase